MSFGKPGRPPEDRLARQNEIYQAVAPLILEHGVRSISMRQAADLSCLSIGGLYHYFPTKRDLVLHGIQAETLHRLCQDFHEQFAHLASTNKEQYFEVFFRHLVESTLFARPAAHAAAQLGIDAFEMVSSSVEKVVVEFIASLRNVAPDLPEADLQTLARAIRRFCLASIIDTSSSNEELRSEFYLLIGGYLQRKNVSLLEIAF